MKHIRVVGCFVEYENTFLILYRNAKREQAQTWGLPAGKVNPHESDIEAMVREIKEETGYKTSDEKLELLGEWEYIIQSKNIDFVAYRLHLTEKIFVTLEKKEHSAYKWVTAQECYYMQNLIQGLHDLLRRVGYIKTR